MADDVHFNILWCIHCSILRHYSDETHILRGNEYTHFWFGGFKLITTVRFQTNWSLVQPLRGVVVHSVIDRRAPTSSHKDNGFLVPSLLSMYEHSAWGSLCTLGRANGSKQSSWEWCESKWCHWWPSWHFMWLWTVAHLRYNNISAIRPSLEQ